MTNDDDKVTRYWEIAYKAIAEGLLTKDEALQIARVGTRKTGYWSRHIDDLQSFIETRRLQSARPGDTTSND